MSRTNNYTLQTHSICNVNVTSANTTVNGNMPFHERICRVPDARRDLGMAPSISRRGPGQCASPCILLCDDQHRYAAVFTARGLINARQEGPSGGLAWRRRAPDGDGTLWIDSWISLFLCLDCMFGLEVGYGKETRAEESRAALADCFPFPADQVRRLAGLRCLFSMLVSC